MTTKRLLPMIIGIAMFLTTAIIVAQEDDNNPGLPFLDQAAEIKLQAQTLPDLKRVVELCEKAKRTGLTGDTLEFCNQLLAATQLQTGNVVARALLSQPPERLPFGWELMRDSALAYLESAVKIIKEQPEPFVMISELNRLPNGDLKRADEALLQAIQVAKDVNDDKQLLAKLQTTLAIYENDPEKRLALLLEALESYPDAVETLMATAAGFADDDQCEKAVELLNKANRLQPENATVLGVLTAVYSKMKQWDEAIATLDQLQKLMPTNPIPLVEKAKIFLQQKKTDAALALLNEAATIDEKNPLVLLVRATAKIDKRDWDGAVADIDTVLTIAPHSLLPTLLKAQLLAMQEKYDVAVTLLEELQQHTGDQPEVLLELANILAMQKKRTKSLELIQKVLETTDFRKNDPMTWARVMRAQGDTQQSLNQFNESVQSYRAAMAVDTENSVLINNLAWALATSPMDSLRNGKEALELALKANELSGGEEAFILSTVASAYAEIGDFVTATEYIDKALALAEKAVADDDMDQKKNQEQLGHLRKEKASYDLRQPWRELNDEEDVP